MEILHAYSWRVQDRKAIASIYLVDLRKIVEVV
jgi:hypothetical protein